MNKAARLESILKLNVPRFLTWHVFCIKNGHFSVNFLKIRTRPTYAIKNCGWVPRNLVVCTIKNLANTSVYKAFRVVAEAGLDLHFLPEGRK